MELIEIGHYNGEITEDEDTYILFQKKFLANDVFYTLKTEISLTDKDKEVMKYKEINGGKRTMKKRKTRHNRKNKKLSKKNKRKTSRRS